MSPKVVETAVVVVVAKLAAGEEWFVEAVRAPLGWRAVVGVGGAAIGPVPSESVVTWAPGEVARAEARPARPEGAPVLEGERAAPSTGWPRSGAEEGGVVADITGLGACACKSCCLMLSASS
jgi:hypothetical protein